MITYITTKNIVYDFILKYYNSYINLEDNIIYKSETFEKKLDLDFEYHGLYSYQFSKSKLLLLRDEIIDKKIVINLNIENLKYLFTTPSECESFFKNSPVVLLLRKNIYSEIMLAYFRTMVKPSYDLTDLLIEQHIGYNSKRIDMYKNFHKEYITMLQSIKEYIPLFSVMYLEEYKENPLKFSKKVCELSSIPYEENMLDFEIDFFLKKENQIELLKKEINLEESIESYV